MQNQNKKAQEKNVLHMQITTKKNPKKNTPIHAHFDTTTKRPSFLFFSHIQHCYSIRSLTRPIEKKKKKFHRTQTSLRHGKKKRRDVQKHGKRFLLVILLFQPRLHPQGACQRHATCRTHTQNGDFAIDPEIQMILALVVRSSVDFGSIILSSPGLLVGFIHGHKKTNTTKTRKKMRRESAEGAGRWSIHKKNSSQQY